MRRKPVSLLITDVDNTLFDWVDIWYYPFRAMLDKIIEISGVPESTLRQEIRQIHQKHGTSEYAFLIEELPSLQTKFGRDGIFPAFDPAVNRFREERRRVLKLYPGVMDTLKAIRRQGSLIVAYTDSMEFYTNYRIRKLHLDEVLDFLYSPPDHVLPKGLTRDKIRKYAPVQYKLKHTVHRCIPQGEMKPNPNVLQSILAAVGGHPDSTIYVGDSLMHDIIMAQDAGITDVLADYGHAQSREEYELLRAVTHWTDEKVKREKSLSPKEILPSIRISSFRQLLDEFDFVEFGG